MKRITLTLDPALWAQVRQACQARRLTASQLVTGLLLRQMQRWEREAAPPPSQSDRVSRARPLP